MKLRISTPLTILHAALIVVSADLAVAETLDFESVPVGTSYGGSDGHNPGDIVLMEDDIVMSVESFASTAGAIFGQAVVGGDYMPFFQSTPLQMNNIDARFDFTGLDLPVGILRLEFRDFGGTVDFSLNDGTRYILDDLTDLPSVPEPGYETVVVPPISFNGFGVLTIYGFGIESVQLGGQELVVDRVIATTVPEPATALLMALGAGAMLRRRRRLG